MVVEASFRWFKLFQGVSFFLVDWNFFEREGVGGSLTKMSAKLYSVTN